MCSERLRTWARCTANSSTASRMAAGNAWCRTRVLLLSRLIADADPSGGAAPAEPGPAEPGPAEPGPAEPAAASGRPTAAGDWPFRRPHPARTQLTAEAHDRPVPTGSAAPAGWLMWWVRGADAAG
ncbi:hypothetical protein GCM10012279_00280 [Micromonospora yangpuensis]|nr:hypothetical protein GCM10012279_00280 [Micromonospora yangpuensis]